MDQFMNVPLIATILAVLVGFKAFIFGCMKLLESFMDKTSSDVDNKVYSVLKKIYEILGYIK